MTETTGTPPGWSAPEEAPPAPPHAPAPSYPPPTWAPAGTTAPTHPYQGGQPPYGGGWHWGAPGQPPQYQWGGGPAQPPRPTGRAVVAVMIAVGVLVAAVLGGVVGRDLSQSQPVISQSSPSPTSIPSGAPSNAAAIASQVDPGLVDINTIISAESVEGAGTGMVLTSTGEILTNNHVIEDANKISVTDIGNGKTYDANVVGYDRTQDVAVIQLVGASGLVTVTAASSSASEGDGVVAIGNAEGTGGTPSYAPGTVVATDQSITASDEVDGSSEQLSGLIESDCNIVAGDSGGPLVNTSGKVVGMDTAASSGFQFETSGTQGYSIPINTALGIARQIVAGTASSTVHIGPTAFLGVGVRDNSSSSPFGGGSGNGTGAEIVQVVAGEPAASAGLTVGDVITSLGGHSVTSANDLTDVMSTEQPGATVTVVFVNTSGQNQSVQVTLASGPPQ